MKIYLIQLAMAPKGPLTRTQEQVCNYFDLDYRSPYLKMALYEASVDSLRDHGLLISALVINSVTGLPDHSFFALAEEAGRTNKDKTMLWLRELDLIKKTFQYQHAIAQ